MSTLRRAVTGHVTKFLSTVGERQIRVIASDATPDRMGDVLDPVGCRLADFRKNPVMLAQHDSNKPIGRWPSVEIRNGRVEALGEFAPEDVSDLADEYCRLAKAGIINAVSVGFMPIKYEPRKGGGYLYTEWDLVELSLVSVPANPSALIIGRQFSDKAYSGAYRHSRDYVPAPSTLSYCGTLAQRQAQLNWDHPQLERAGARAELDAALAAADSGTREGRRAIVQAHRRYADRTR